MTKAECEANGIRTLPRSLAEALDHLERDRGHSDARGHEDALPDAQARRDGQVAATGIDALCAMYAQVY